MTRKILVNAYFAKNFGDDLFLKILFERYSNVQWHLLTPKKEYKKIFSKYKNVVIERSLDINLGFRRINLFNKLNDEILNYRKYDALVNIGGSIFMEGPNWELGIRQRQSLPQRFRKDNKKVFIIGANFGPFKNELFLKAHREFFEIFDDVCFRDKYSYMLFDRYKNIRYAPDVVFNLKPNKSDIPTGKDKSVGISLINLNKRKDLKKYSKDYYGKVVELAKEYIALGYKIKLFSFCEKEGDLEICNQIKNNFKSKSSESISVINYEEDINSFLNEFQACELIIGTRFHSIILAIINNQGFFPIIYNEKTYNALQDLQMTNVCVSIDNMKNLEINEVIAKTANNKLKDLTMLKEAENQFAKLDKFLEKTN